MINLVNAEHQRLSCGFAASRMTNLVAASP
jgi:hypothetical protein